MSADGLLTAIDVANITATIQSSLDQSLPQHRDTTLGTSNDGYGHSRPSHSNLGNLACTIAKPTASQLQAYAGIIGSQRALVMRCMSTSDVRELDEIAYDGLTWIVQAKMNANSYSVVIQYLITTVI